jgi:hypothetical protein
MEQVPSHDIYKLKVRLENVKAQNSSEWGWHIERIMDLVDEAGKIAAHISSGAIVGGVVKITYINYPCWLDLWSIPPELEKAFEILKNPKISLATPILIDIKQGVNNGTTTNSCAVG